jgi:hypothetical protein
MIEGTTKKGCIPFCRSPRSFVSKVVSTIKNRATGKEEENKVAIRG